MMFDSLRRRCHYRETMKLSILVVLALIALAPLVLFGQTNDPPTGGTLPPLEKGYLWQVAIALVTPMIIQGVKKIVPSVPKGLLPFLTPLVGVGLGLAMNWLMSANLGWVDMGQAGALSVFVYEAFKGATKPSAPPEYTCRS